MRISFCCSFTSGSLSGRKETEPLPTSLFMSTKVEYPPLFTPGFHAVTVERLEEVCVLPFGEPSRTHRQQLIDRFKIFLDQLKATGVRCDVWIDGSFTTEKVDPSDIDLLVVLNPVQLRIMKLDKQTDLKQLLNRPVSKLRYKCDVLTANKGDEYKLSYWRGWYGFARNDEPKGIARMKL
jgi:predicted nucleotidyltransferase